MNPHVKIYWAKIENYSLIFFFAVKQEKLSKRQMKFAIQEKRVIVTIIAGYS